MIRSSKPLLNLLGFGRRRWKLADWQHSPYIDVAAAKLRVGFGWRQLVKVGLMAAAVAALLPRCTPISPIAIQSWGPGQPGSTAGAAASAGCGADFAGGAVPQLVNAKLARRTTLLCYAGYSVLFSGVTRTPLWSAERLTGPGVDAATQLERVNEFHPDSRLPADDRSELEDYRRSGFDRGHMSPSGDMPTADAQAQSFSLANIVPQAPGLNRGKWSAIETDVRQMARQAGTVYVVTGPLFEGAQLATIGGRVIVPTSVFKAIYIPGQGAAAYIGANVDPTTIHRVSIAELDAAAGIDVFPELAPADRARELILPLPQSHRSR